MIWTIEQNVDIRENASMLEYAEKMAVGDSIGKLTKSDAGKLARAIEQVHGARTATIKERNDGYRVWRVEQRPEKTRKPRTRKNELAAV